MERSAEPAVVTFFSTDPFVPGSTLTLGDDAAQHARVLRIVAGAAIELRDGAGHAARGLLARTAKRSLTVDVTSAWEIGAPASVHLLAPVADRDRMLLLAEKCTELGLASWRPVMWRRSRSVGPRGDGPSFQSRVRGRMISALTQSGGGWLPEVHPSARVEHAIAAAPAGTRLILDASAPTSIAAVGLVEPVVMAVGPEGGIDDRERDQMVEGGFTPVRLGGNTLRFETAGIAAVSIVRTLLDAGGHAAVADLAGTQPSEE